MLRYPHPRAIWQKLRALATRREVQARNVFDLHHLMQPCFGAVPIELLRQSLTADILADALSRTCDVDPVQFAEKIDRYLPMESRDRVLAHLDRNDVVFTTRRAAQSGHTSVQSTARVLQDMAGNGLVTRVTRGICLVPVGIPPAWDALPNSLGNSRGRVTAAPTD